MMRRVPLTLTAFLIGLTLGSCDKKKGVDVENPGQVTCEEDRDICKATCVEDCEERTYCDKESDTILAECTQGCEDRYTECIL